MDKNDEISERRERLDRFIRSIRSEPTYRRLPDVDEAAALRETMGRPNQSRDKSQQNE